MDIDITNGPPSVAFETLGCKLNQAETELLARQLRESGCRIVSPKDQADIYILNTCTVTHVADRKSRHLLRMARRRNPRGMIIALGCFADSSGQSYPEVEGIDLIIGNKQKSDLKQILVESGYLNIKGGSQVTEEATNLTTLEKHNRTRSFVKIQDGCNNFCAYCIVPLVRGTEKSVPPDFIIDEIRTRTAEGFQEVVLTGTEIGCYNSGNLDLTGLVERVLNETDIRRIRLSSLQPQEISTELVRLWKDPRLCRHFHLSLQCGSDEILGRMGRKYTTDEYRTTVDLLRFQIPDVSITTDIIVGFPGETEQEFRQSYDFCCDIKFSRIHVFSFSPRTGTRAAQMPNQIEPGIKKKRSGTMLALARNSCRQHNERFLGQTMPVLFEQQTDGLWEGLTSNYIRVLAMSDRDLANAIIPTKLIDLQRDGVKGEIEIQGE